MCFVMTFMCSLQGISYAEYSVGLDKGQEIGGGVRMIRPDGAKSARVIQVIETRAIRGLGTEKDPVRDVT